MDNQHKQIKGYRDLNQAEIDLMNEIKTQGIVLDNLVAKVNEFNASVAHTDLAVLESEAYRWAAIAKTDFQTGLMALTRAVAKPEFF